MLALPMMFGAMSSVPVPPSGNFIYKDFTVGNINGWTSGVTGGGTISVGGYGITFSGIPAANNAWLIADLQVNKLTCNRYVIAQIRCKDGFGATSSPYKQRAFVMISDSVSVNPAASLTGNNRGTLIDGRDTMDSHVISLNNFARTDGTPYSWGIPTGHPSDQEQYVKIIYDTVTLSAKVYWRNNYDSAWSGPFSTGAIDISGSTLRIIIGDQNFNTETITASPIIAAASFGHFDADYSTLWPE